MKRNKAIQMLCALVLVLPMLLASTVGFTQTAHAAETGSLTIHKLFNPNYNDNTFIGDGTEAINDEGKVIGNQGTPTDPAKPIQGTPLAGVIFKIAPVTPDDYATLGLDENGAGTITQANAETFLQTATVQTGTTGADGTVKFSGLPVNTADLENNKWLVVETDNTGAEINGKPVKVVTQSTPVLVNVPVDAVNPPEGATGDALYNYDVHLFMKNYNPETPGIDKEIDQPTHSTNDVVTYTIKMNDLPADIGTYKRLEVTDKIDSRLDFLPSPEDSIGEVTLVGGTTPDYKFQTYVTTDPNLNQYSDTLPAGTEVFVRYDTTTSNLVGSKYIYWGFTEAGIEKLGELYEPGMYIELSFSMIQTINGAVPNQADLGYINEWDYGTEPTDPEPPKPGEPGEPGEPTDPKPEPPVPSNVVNTISGNANFTKVDATTKATIEGAQFIIQDTPLVDVTTKNGTKYTDGTTIYAILENGNVIDWTTDESKATVVTSDENGQFNVTGLAYTYAPIFPNQFIFAEMGPARTIGNSTSDPIILPTIIPGKDMVFNYANRNEELPTYTSDHYLATVGATTPAPPSDELAYLPAVTPSIEGQVNPNAWSLYKTTQQELPEGTTLVNVDISTQLHNYELVEVKAPNGYVLPKDSFEFEVPLTDGEGIPLADQNTDIKNIHEPNMPITGGMGTIIFLVVGIALMGGAYYIRQQKTV